MTCRSGFCARVVVVLTASIMALPALTAAQEPLAPSLRVGSGAETLSLDGNLNEDAWRMASVSDALTQVEPVEGGVPSVRTTVRVLASRDALVIGITCEDPQPNDIVSFSVRRDAPLDQEDHVRVVLGPFRDGRSGYIFAVNPRGARFDGIIESGGETINAQWDGIWEAVTARNEAGWSAEIRIPIQTLSFNPAVREWHFNFERRIQRRLELDRWASAVRQYPVTMTVHAGLLTGLPAFTLGRGLSVRPAIAAGGGIPAPSASMDADFHPSLDVTQRLGANITASFTANTDFAETEVDTRQTNLTRFPLFFPEKRTFFLEGADILHLAPPQNDLIPYFSRRMGLVNGREVPIIAGGKVNGRVGSASFAGVIVAADREPGVVEERTTTAVVRVKQNLWRESYVGFMGTAGDPLGRSGSWLAGVDFTYLTSTFMGNKNFSVNGAVAGTGRSDLGNDRLALIGKIDYPNEKWNIRLWYRRAGRDFDPSLGFVPRRAMQRVNPAISNRTLFARGPIQEVNMGVNPIVTLDLHGRWETYESGITVVNWRFRSGDRIQFTVTPSGDRPGQPFHVSPGVVISPAEYTWVRRRAGFTTAQKRPLSVMLTRTWGPFYDGDLTEWNTSLVWNPTPLYTLEFTGERHKGSLSGGAFTQHLIGTRLRINISSNLSIASYAQYDTDSESVGVNSRLSWTFLPVADLFVVYNHNIRSLLDRWDLESNQLVVKMQYAWRR